MSGCRVPAVLVRLAGAACLLGLLGFLGAVGAASVPQENALETNAVDTIDSRGPRVGGAAGTARAVLSEIARELISRSATSSQVLSLNLTNLVILLVLKAIIFGASTMGLGWGGKARSAVDDEGVPAGSAPLLSEQEALLLLGFLMGDQREGYHCLHRVACQEPDAANSYARAGMLLSKGAKLLQGVMPYDDRYDNIVSELAEAVEYGRSGGKCDAKYSCSRS